MDRTTDLRMNWLQPNPVTRIPNFLGFGFEGEKSKTKFGNGILIGRVP